MDIPFDSDYLLTIIVPLYNEEGNLSRLANELADWLAQSSVKAKILFVNDGSKDNSAKLLEQICEGDDSFNFITLDKNYGLSTALKAGFDMVDTKLTGYIDADLQTSPYDFDRLLEFADSYELVTGVRFGRKDGVIKRISSRMASAIRRSITLDGATDTGCPLKIFQTRALHRISFFVGMHRFLPALIQLDGGRVKEVPVRHFHRLAGKSNYHLHNRLLGPAIDLMAFIWVRNRYIRYKIKGRA